MYGKADSRHTGNDIECAGFAVQEKLEAWREAFARTLIPDLMQEAATYAQTIAYGFFAARCHHDMSKGVFERKNAQADIPKTNPLLRALFVNLTGPDLKEEPYCRFVEDLIQSLALADMWNILKDFGERDKRTDPVIHFYATFLSAYDPALRKKRGVYYTSEFVVPWLVSSADAVVREKFAIPQGLADNAHTLKTTTADGESLDSEGIDSGSRLRHRHLSLQNHRPYLKQANGAGIKRCMVNFCEGKSSCPRIFGFGLLMAPYAVPTSSWAYSLPVI